MDHLKLGVLLLITPLFASTALAEPVWYVHDYLIITMRAGPGDDFKILRTIPTGTALEVLEEGDTFVHVRAEDGVEGWVHRQYMSKKPIARIQLEQALAKLDQLENSQQTLIQSETQLKKANKELLEKVARIEKENTRLSKDNAIFKDVAARPIEIESQNKLLAVELEQITSEAIKLREVNKTLKASAAQKWFMAGSGVLFFGIILGLFLPRLRSRKSSGWS